MIEPARPNSWLQYTNYHRAPSGLKKLSFIVRSIRKYQGQFDNAQVSILDIGCGIGNAAIPLASLGYRVIAIDKDQTTLREARARCPFDNIVFICGDAENLSLRHEFDFVACLEIFEHLNHPESLAAAAYELLKPNGKLLATIPNGWGPYELSERFLSALKRWGLGGPLKGVRVILQRLGLWLAMTTASLNPHDPHVQSFTFGRFRALLESFGLEIVETSNSDVLAAVFPFSILSKKCRQYVQMDCTLADILPHFMVSGWYVVASPSGSSQREVRSTNGA